MKRIDQRPIPENRDEIRAFLVIRNEALRLPSTLRHHRSLGVHRFFVLDNGSTDGTLDYLSAQPDVHLFSTTDSYSQSQCGIVWTNALLNAFGTGHWTLTIDADEQFIYPHYEQVNLSLFCEHLDSIGVDTVPCLLLDMYSDLAIQDASHNPGGSLLETCSYFDRAPYRLTPVSKFPHLEIYGGVRERLFQQIKSEHHSPTISKAPLVRWRPGKMFLLSTHFLTAGKLSPVLAALLHFKFLSDFHDRVQMEVARGEHFADAREYRAYLQMLRANGKVNLLCNESTKFKSSTQLIELGLMATSKAYEASVELNISTRPADAKPETATAA